MAADFKVQYPTWGDLAREQVRRQGLLYFGDVQKSIRELVSELPLAPRRAFAVGCAARAARRRIVDDSRYPLAVGLDALWQGLQTQDTQSAEDVRNALAASRSGLESTSDVDEASEDDAADSFAYACECFLNGDPEAAYWASACAIDAAFRTAENELQLDPNEFVWDPSAEPMPLAKEAMHPAVQEELRRQLDDLALLAAADRLGPEMIDHLRG